VTSRDEVVGDFRAMADMLFLERRAISTVFRGLYPSLYGGRPQQRYPHESDAIAAVAARMRTGGNVQILAKMLEDNPDSVPFSPDELMVLSRAANKVLHRPDFSHELYNGDINPLMDDAIREARERYGVVPDPITLADSGFADLDPRL